MAKTVKFLILALALAVALMLGFAEPLQAQEGPDILGVRTGMKPEQISSIMKKEWPTAKAQVSDGVMQFSVESTTPVQDTSGNFIAPLDRMAIYLMKTGGGEVVRRAERTLNGQKMVRTQVIDGLKKKYGNPFSSAERAESTDMGWVFDEQGHPANISEQCRKAARDVAYLVALAQSYRTAKIDCHQNVDIIVKAKVSSAPADRSGNLPPKDIVVHVNVGIDNLALARRAQEENTKAADSQAEKQHQQDLEKAKQNKTKF